MPASSGEWGLRRAPHRAGLGFSGGDRESALRPPSSQSSFSPRVLLVYPLLGWAGQAPRLTCPASALIISFLDSWPSHSEHTQPWKASETALGPCPLVSEPSQAQVTLGGKNPPSQPPCRAPHARPSGPLSPVSQLLGLLPCALVVLLLHP